MKNIIVYGTVFCLALVSFSQKVMAGPVPISAQEGSQLSELAHNDALLTLKAGGSFPNAPEPLAAKEEWSLMRLEENSPNLSSLKAGDGAGDVLVWVVVICVCVVLLRLVNIIS